MMLGIQLSEPSMQADKVVTYYSNFDWLRLLFALQVVAIHCGVVSTVFINPVPAFLAISGMCQCFETTSGLNLVSVGDGC